MNADRNKASRRRLAHRLNYNGGLPRMQAANQIAFYDLDGTLISSNVVTQYAFFVRKHPSRVTAGVSRRDKSGPVVYNARVPVWKFMCTAGGGAGVLKTGRAPWYNLWNPMGTRGVQGREGLV